MQQNLTNELSGISGKLSGFELTYNVLNRLSDFDLTLSAKLVLVFLTTFYNAKKNGAVVFPSIQHIADTLGIGQTAVKQAIKDLVLNGLILKSKLNKTGNHNKYVLSLKVQNPTVKQPENDFFKQSDFDRFMKETSNSEQINEQTAKMCTDIIRFAKDEMTTGVSRRNDSLERKHFQDNNNVVVLKTRTVIDSDVPDFIKLNKNVKNPCAYWASLAPEIKAELLKRDSEQKAAEKQRQEEKRLEEIEKQKEQKEYERWKMLPLKNKYTKKQAIALINAMPVEMMKKSKIAKELTELYQLHT